MLIETFQQAKKINEALEKCESQIAKANKINDDYTFYVTSGSYQVEIPKSLVGVIKTLILSNRQQELVDLKDSLNNL